MARKRRRAPASDPTGGKRRRRVGCRLRLLPSDVFELVCLFLGKDPIMHKIRPGWVRSPWYKRDARLVSRSSRMLHAYALMIPDLRCFERVYPTARPLCYVRPVLVTSTGFANYLRHKTPIASSPPCGAADWELTWTDLRLKGLIGLHAMLSRFLRASPIQIRERDQSTSVAYESRSCHREFFQLGLTTKVGLVAMPKAVSHDHDRVFVCHSSSCSPDGCPCTDRINLNAVMAVWDAGHASVVREETVTRPDGQRQRELVVVSDHRFRAAKWEKTFALVRWLLSRDPALR